MLNSAKYYANGEIIQIPGTDLMSHAKPYFITPAHAFVAYPNRDSTSFREAYNIPEAETVVRGTLRYQGFPQFIGVLVKIGFLNEKTKDWLVDSITWREVTQKAISAQSAEEKVLVEKIVEIAQLSDVAEKTRIISGLRWIGLFSDERVEIRAGNLLDTLCARLEKLMAYGEGERDLIMLQHKFVVEWKDGSDQVITSTLEAYGVPGGHSAMALTVGVPCGIAVQLVLDGVIKEPGVCAPYSKALNDPIIELLEKEGISMVERYV